ncbi:MAG TPA: transcription antitermination factor NusB [Oligoflexia bacterium]|nr:transcription antitermination factor NusB [Oligoflexia bacterium]
MGVRRQARQAALQALYMCDFLGRWEAEDVAFCFDHFVIPAAARGYAVKLCEGVFSNLPRIDSLLTRASENWSLSRMGRVDRAILRLATFEIAFSSEVPANVAINEAIEIAKFFGADESPVFVNGVLDKVAQIQRGKLKVEVVLEPERKEPEHVVFAEEEAEELPVSVPLTGTRD